MATQWLKNLSHKAAHVKMLNPVYNASLGKPDDFLTFSSFPLDLFGGDAGRGRWIASGQIDINGFRLPLDQDNWMIGGETQHSPFFDKLHGFDFLSELKSLGGDIGRKTARAITQKWLNHFQHYHHIIWDVPLTAQRLVNWMIAYPYAFETATDEFIIPLQHSLYRQYYHLVHSLGANKNMDRLDRFTLLWAIIIVQAHCEDFYDDMSFQTHLQLLKGTLDDILLPDGGLTDRNPQNILEMLKSLIQLRQSLLQSAHTPPAWLGSHIESTGKIVTIIQHSDGDFPQFQGCILPNKKEIEKALKQSALRFRRMNMHYNDTGITAIRNGKTSLLIDHGNGGPHVAPLAFELAYAGNRMIVSCGTHASDPLWMESLSTMAAHSTMMIDGVNPNPALLKTQSSLENLNGAGLFYGSHDGYAATLGLSHTRRLYLDHDGEDVRGEDLLTRNIAIKPLETIARFHLHPMVKASFIDNKSAILLRLGNGTGWVFRCGSGTLNIEESIHCADGFTLRKTQQIVLRHSMDDLSLQIKWAFKKQ